jgi:L-threonylcarbamoyladenylate synthase
MTMASDISEAAALLRGGGLVAIPTETVYGLAADATNDRAVASIFEAKGRPHFNPLISHVGSIAKAVEFGQFNADARKLAEAFWPGPLTLVVERQTDCPISLLCSAGLSTVALRVPSHPKALELLQAVDRPLAAPSANPSGRISPTTADHVRASLGHAVDMVLDGGPCQIGLESTVVRITGEGPCVLRVGGILKSDMESCLGRAVVTPHRVSTELHSPGQMESHYAPQAMMRLNAIEPAPGEIFLGFGKHNHGPWNLSSTANLQEASANLFRMLHELDEASPEVIAVAPIPLTGLGEAINDRLQRAAAPRPKS